MKHATHFRILAFVLLCLSFSLPLKALEVQMRNAVFYAPEEGPYLETNILILGSSIGYTRLEDGKFQGNVQVTLVIKNTSNEIVDADKYMLQSVEVDDTSNVSLGIVDKKRFLLPNGTYVLEATFIDQVSGAKELVTNAISIDHNYDGISLSDIDLIEEYHKSDETDNVYVKSGVYMTPLVINFYPENINNLRYYFEFYDPVADGSDQVLVKTAIKRSGQPGIPYGHYLQRKMKLDVANSFLGEFDISNLPSGNYDLSVEVRDKQNNLLASKTMFFQRSKFIASKPPDDVSNVDVTGTFVDTMSLEELHYDLRSLRPTASPLETSVIKGLLKNDDLQLNRQFFLNFWLTRNDLDPYLAWSTYKKKVDLVNYEFSTNINEGFETDRGRVYLQYGPPSQILDMPREPGAYPYQIWHYYGKAGNQTNVKFVFYNTDLVTNDYRLIHSTALNEIYNNDWKRLVYGTFTGGNSPTDDGSYSPGHFGSRADENFDE